MADYNDEQIIHERVSSTFERSIAHLENLMVVICEFHEGPMINPEKPHSHPHEQITYVAEGELEFYKGDDMHHLVKGDIILIPSGIAHCIKSLSPYVKLIDSFSPVRQDYIK